MYNIIYQLVGFLRMTLNMGDNKVILLIYLFVFQNLMTHHLKILSVSHTKNKLITQSKSIHTKNRDNRDILKENKYFSDVQSELCILLFIL